MTEQVMWGLLLVAYIVPFWLWQISAHNTVEIRKELYPGRKEEEVSETRVIWLGLGWCVGLAVLLFAWHAGWHPMGFVLLVGALVATVGFWHAARKHRHLIHNQLFRGWVAGSVVWALGVGGWYVVFNRVSELTSEEYVYLALIPPVLAAAGIFAWRWARAKA